MQSKDPRPMSVTTVLKTSIAHSKILFLLVVLSSCLQNNTALKKETLEVHEHRNKQTDHGLAAMVKGNNDLAQQYFNQALKTDPHDVHAMLGLGLLYQDMGDVGKAKTIYQGLLKNPEGEKRYIKIWPALQSQPINDVARKNLRRLDNVQQKHASNHGETPDKETQQDTSSPVNIDYNIVTRFIILDALKKEGLVSEKEAFIRREANKGALLPLSHHPPSRFLALSVPKAEQFIERLKALGLSLQKKEITPLQHHSERIKILNSLLPDPETLKIMMTYSDGTLPLPKNINKKKALIRLDTLKNKKLITRQEYEQEKHAIDQKLHQKGRQPPKKIVVIPPSPSIPSPSIRKTTAPGLHLASFRHRKNAQKAWEIFYKKHGDVFQDLKPYITPVDLGPEKGIFYRLRVGIFDNEETAKMVCEKLKQRQQHCAFAYIRH